MWKRRKRRKKIKKEKRIKTKKKKKIRTKPRTQKKRTKKIRTKTRRKKTKRNEKKRRGANATEVVARRGVEAEAPRLRLEGARKSGVVPRGVAAVQSVVEIAGVEAARPAVAAAVVVEKEKAAARSGAV